MKSKTQKAFNGNLVITEENKHIYTNITTVNGDLKISKTVNFITKKLTEVSGSIDVREGATLTAPALTEVSGSIYVYQGATLTAPALTEVSGSIYVLEGATLTIPQTKGLNYKSVDNTLFVIDHEKTSKGIKILTGYVIEKISDGKSVKRNCFVSEKDGFFAHGETIKKSISDLQFKIVSEKLKKEPINADTIITINHYRLITGACELGIKSWMESTFDKKELKDVSENGIKASDLLPILKQKNAYGLDRFNQLVSF